MIEETLVSILKNATGVEVVALEKPQGISCITYKRISTKPYRNHSNKNIVNRCRYELICYGGSLNESRGLAEICVDILEANTTDFILSTFENGNYTKNVDGLYSYIVQFFIWD